MLKDKNINFQYNIIGDVINDEILYQIKDLGIENYVNFLPKMSHPDVIREISNSDIFLLPSVEEGIANVVYEAMANKTLVVSTDYPGMKEIIKHKKTGLLFKSRDELNLAEIVEESLSLDKTLNDSIINRAYELICTNHSFSFFRSEFLNFYKQ